MHRHYWALKAGFNPAQPRIPRKQPGAGEWTDDESSPGRIRLAGDIPTNDTPEIPKERPPNSRERTGFAKVVARMLGPAATVAEIAKFGAWLTAYAPSIQSYSDPPKSLEELQQAVSTPAPGYDIHYIVEQTQAERDGFPREIIDSPDNLVRIPTMKHQEINGWYQRESREFGGITPREYLSGRNWGARRAVGLDALRDRGVLK